MNVAELIRAAKSAKPNLENLSDQQCRQLLLAAFRVVRQTIDQANPGELSIGGLGTFRIRLIEREHGGQAVQIKRTIFVAAKREADSPKLMEQIANRPGAKKMALGKARPNRPTVAAPESDVSFTKPPARKRPAAKSPAGRKA